MIDYWPWNVPFSSLSQEELFEHFGQCLKRHDWTYDYSDDFTMVERGEYEFRYIDALREHCSAVDKQRADTLFYRHSFWHNDDGTERRY